MAAIGSKGVTISVGQVYDFDKLSEEHARQFIEEQVIPACENKGVKLSRYGNHAGEGSFVTVEKYDEKKQEHTLFNVKRIQKVFASLDAIVIPTTQYKVGSYGLKQVVEKYQHKDISNGDLIVAMLLKGYAARFGKQTEGMAVNCEFKAKVLV